MGFLVRHCENMWMGELVASVARIGASAGTRRYHSLRFYNANHCVSESDVKLSVLLIWAPHFVEMSVGAGEE